MATRKEPPGARSPLTATQPIMHNEILWNIDNELDGHRFERLCSDLLSREGFEDIVPVGGPRDHGRDAEIRIYRGTHRQLGIIFFQYSLERKWEKKLCREQEKIRRYGHAIDAFIFVTSQSVTGERRDLLRERAKSTFGWQLEIYEREWLRHRLEEAHPDLAARHLGISLPPERRTVAAVPSEMRKHPPEAARSAWDLLRQTRFEAATPAFLDLIQETPTDSSLWKALAWCQYSTYRYRDALGSIRHTLKLDPSDTESLSIKACILTEEAISTGSRAGLLEAKKIFGTISAASARWVDFYNFGNVLHALGEYEEARRMLTQASEMAPERAEVWKNLGTIHFHLHEHHEELACYDRALSIDPHLPEALCSKAVTYILVFQRFDEARQLLNSARTARSSLDLHWPRFWFWLAFAAHHAGDQHAALEALDAGLEIVPAAEDLLSLKVEVLAKLWRSDPAYRSAAIHHLQHTSQVLGADLGRDTELGRVYLASGDDDRVLQILSDLVGCDPSRLIAYRDLTTHSLAEFVESLPYLPLYKRYRQARPVRQVLRVLQGAGVGPSADFEEAMMVICFPAFALACEHFRTSRSDDRLLRARQAFERIAESLACALPKLVAKLLERIRADSVDHLADGLASLLASWPEQGLREVSSEFGFAGGRFGFTSEELDAGIIGDKCRDLLDQLTTETLVEANKMLHFAPEA